MNHPEVILSAELNLFRQLIAAMPAQNGAPDARLYQEWVDGYRRGIESALESLRSRDPRAVEFIAALEGRCLECRASHAHKMGCSKNDQRAVKLPVTVDLIETGLDR